MAQDFSGRLALVTGGNRGIGREVVRQLAGLGFTVLLGSRDLEKGEREARALAGEGLKVFARRLDVTDAGSIEAVRAGVEAEPGRLDVLVNNAAVLYDSWQRAADADLRTVREAFETNTLGPWRMCQAFGPLLARGGRGRVVNVSSESGSLASMSGGTPAYGVSKAALNALTRMLADEFAASGVLVNSVCPGWVATEMGGPGAPRSVEEGAAGIVWAATLPDGGPTGGFFRDGQPLPW